MILTIEWKTDKLIKGVIKMLRTNSKKAKENIERYIIEHFDYTGHEKENEPTPETYKDICKCIYNTMISEKLYAKETNNYATFKSWCQGLPSILDTCYYYNRSAINDLKEILEESDEEASKFGESEAEERLTYLLYREITSNMN